MDERFENLQREMDRRFEKVDERFENLQREMDRRFERVEKGQEEIKFGLKKLNVAVGSLDTRSGINLEKTMNLNFLKLNIRQIIMMHSISGN